jgi:hypothetical protein
VEGHLQTSHGGWCGDILYKGVPDTGAGTLRSSPTRCSSPDAKRPAIHGTWGTTTCVLELSALNSPAAPGAQGLVVLLLLLLLF